MNGLKEAGLVDALENGVVVPPQHDEMLSDDETDILILINLTH